MSSYQKDFYSWACEQAELLKAGCFNELDVSNFIEEIETIIRGSKETGLDMDAFPSACPWEFAQLMDDAFLPD